MRILWLLGVAVCLPTASLLPPHFARAQTSASVHSLFIGDRDCGDNIADCSYFSVVAAHRYLHVVVHDFVGYQEWQVQVAATCGDSMPTVATAQPVGPDGYLEVVVDLAAQIDPQNPACFVFRGRGHFYVTYYAAYFDDVPTADAESVYPGFKSLAGRPDLPDLDVTYIHRDPAYAFDSSQPLPRPGEDVAYTAHVRNAGGLAAPQFRYSWTIDGVTVQSGSADAALPPGQEDTFTVHWRWEDAPHELRFQVVPSGPETSTTNDGLAIRTNAVSLGFWVEQGAYNYFAQYQWSYCLNLPCAGSNSFEDWLQRQVSAWNALLARSVYADLAPTGVADRVRLDALHVVPDGSLPLHGGPATNTPDSADHSVDLEWGLPAAGVEKAYHHQYEGAFDVDWATIHELNHARYLSDLYRFDIPTGADNLIEVRGGDGRPIYDPAQPFDAGNKLRAFLGPAGNAFVYENLEQDLMSCPCTPTYSAYTAVVLNRIRNRRATCGNTNPPCNLGEWFPNLPPVNRIQILDAAGVPVQQASVRLFFDRVRGYAAHQFGDADSKLISTAKGSFDLGPDPFHWGTDRGAPAHNLLLLEIQTASEDTFCFVEPSTFNLAYWTGYRDAAHPAVYTLKLGTQTHNSCALARPPVRITSPFATSPFASTVNIGPVHSVSGKTVRTVLVSLVDDARPPDPMSRRIVHVLDNAGRLLGSATSGRQGRARIEVPAAVTSVGVQDVTDNGLWISRPPSGPLHGAVRQR